MKKTIKVLAFATLLFSPLAVFAQDKPADAKPASTEVKKSFIDVLKEGGLCMIPIGACSVATVWLIIDVWLRTNKSKLTPETDLAIAQQSFRAGDYVGAYQAMKASTSPFASVIRAGLSSIGFGKDATEEAIVSAVDKVNSTIQTRVNYLSVIGVCTPMIGLLGTVSGMRSAFATLGSSGIGDPTKLSEHIGEVLIATASGLFIAIPAFMGFYFLKNKLQSGVHYLEEEAERLFRNAPYEYLQNADVGQEETFAALPNWIDAPAG